jgi:hypothetical protein
MEYKSENKICQNCSNNFTIESDDFGFYEKIKVPPPTFCPECRRQRRNAWRNTFSLYSRECQSCQKHVVSIYAPDSPITIYCNKCWWSDKWEAKSFVVDYDFSRTFFTQFRELINKVPHMSVVNDDGIASLNCEYTQDWWFSKNCYMCFSGWHVENVMYSFFVLAGKNIMDCMCIRTTSEWLYESFICSKCYQVRYSEECLSCIDSQFLYDCRDCLNCFMSAGLRSKKYYFKNKQYSKEEYEKILLEYKLETLSGVEKAKKEFNQFLLAYPRRGVQNFQCTNCTGAFVSYSKNSKNCFIVKNSENLHFCEYVGDNSAVTKDCYDVTTTGGASECYECVVGDHSQLNLFGLFSVKSQDIRYSQHCHNCKHIFGCVGLRNASYCIFNKQYTKEEYEELVPKIIEQMNTMPYIDHIGKSYGYGEFYPVELSPFGYNETMAIEDELLTKDEAVSRGYNWQDHLQRTEDKETLKPDQIPESIKDVDDSILNEVLACMECKRNYKIVPNELIFYKKMEISIPRKCFYCRHKARLARRNPFKLWYRKCMKEGCQNEFETSYAPERPEIIYCEKCYQQEVY